MGKAEAISRAEAAKIEAEAAVPAAKLKAEALKIETESELERLKAAREADVKFALEQNQLEIEKAEQMVSAIGRDTMLAMASGPQDHQVKMLQSLGLSSTLITDGRTPINLLSTASGLLGNTINSEKE